MSAVFNRRFDELDKQAAVIDSSKRMRNTSWGTSAYYIEQSDLLNWRVKVRHLIVSVCGSDSQHLKLFADHEKGGMYTTNYEVFRELRAVFLAAKEDYEGGYLQSLKHLVQAEVFESELEQASELLSAGYMIAAAVISGVVLETGLREMCADRGIIPGKLDKMNADLARAGVYSRLVQKQITALADIRNSAAHGKVDQFTRDDVFAMIRDVQRILATGSS